MGKKLKALVEQKNISQVQLAEVAGVSQAFMSYVLNGYKTPSVQVLKRIADFLDVTVDDLIDEE